MKPPPTPPIPPSISFGAPLQGRGHAPGGFGQGLRLGTQKEIHQASAARGGGKGGEKWGKP